MELDNEKIDRSALALLYLTLHDDYRAWKSIDWEVTGRLYEKGLIQNPVNKAKSVAFTKQGLEEAERCFRELFAKQSSL
jgi:hypothetical protein